MSNYSSSDRIAPSTAYFIKLGSGGAHEARCIEKDDTLWLGYIHVPHEFCQNGEWDKVRDLLIQTHGTAQGAATRHVNQIRAFYKSDETVLWVTFYKNLLWWCFAETGIQQLPDGSKIRQTRGGWKFCSIHGEPLDMGRLSGSLTSTQSFRGTICSVKEFDYLVRKINGERSPLEQGVLDARNQLERVLEQSIKLLNWKAFELLVDLIFRQAGWQRIGQLGKTQKTLDLDLFSPIANERYLVQVKSKAGRLQFEHFLTETSDMEVYNRYFFIVHTPSSTLGKNLETETCKLWFPAEIAQLVVRYGLVDWVIDRTM